MRGRIEESIWVDHNEGNLGDFVQGSQGCWSRIVAVIMSREGGFEGRGGAFAFMVGVVFGGVFEVAHVIGESGMEFGADGVELRDFEEEFGEIFG